MKRGIVKYVVIPLGVIIGILFTFISSIYKSYSIPTPSMEETLLMGDVIFCRTNGETERGKVSIFITPVDHKTHYIKRCIAIGGDSIQIKNKEIFVNGKPISAPAGMQYSYKVYTQNEFPLRLFRKYKISNFKNEKGNFEKNYILLDSIKRGYVIDLSKSKAEEMIKDKVADSIKLVDYSELDSGMLLFPFSEKTREWTTDNYGPYLVPKKGMTIKLDSTTVSFYERTIHDYEGWQSVEVSSGNELVIDGKKIKSYTFKKDYYFMIGDNFNNSADSRMFGPVPDNYIVGTATMIFYSVDPDGAQTGKIFRWNRSFNSIK